MGARAFVGKPYQARTLLQLVRDVLDGSAAANEDAANGAEEGVLLH
jgi:hypothetical protein